MEPAGAETETEQLTGPPIEKPEQDQGAADQTTCADDPEDGVGPRCEGRFRRVRHEELEHGRDGLADGKGHKRIQQQPPSGTEVPEAVAKGASDQRRLSRALGQLWFFARMLGFHNFFHGASISAYVPWYCEVFESLDRDPPRPGCP